MPQAGGRLHDSRGHMPGCPFASIDTWMYVVIIYIWVSPACVLIVQSRHRRGFISCFSCFTYRLQFPKPTVLVTAASCRFVAWRLWKRRKREENARQANNRWCRDVSGSRRHVSSVFKPFCISVPFCFRFFGLELGFLSCTGLHQHHG